MIPGRPNPLRWSCDTSGCFNKLKRFKIEVFAECFDNGVGMGDVDAIVEIEGNFLAMEFKAPGTDLPLGQERMFRRLTTGNTNWTVLALQADPEHTTISAYKKYHNGAVSPKWREVTLDRVLKFVRQWHRRARASGRRQARGAA